MRQFLNCVLSTIIIASFRPHRMHRIDEADCYRRRAFRSLCVCVLGTPVSPAKRLNRSRWRFIRSMLCAIIRCRMTMCNWHCFFYRLTTVVFQNSHTLKTFFSTTPFQRSLRFLLRKLPGLLPLLLTVFVFMF